MDRLNSGLYLEDLDICAHLNIDWEFLNGRRIAISGATGMIGTFLIDALMMKREDSDFDCELIALGRDEGKARKRLPYFNRKGFKFLEVDICSSGALSSISADVVFHLASTTHPVAYVEDPVGTIYSNISGLKNLSRIIDAAKAGDVPNFVFASSVEAYGQNRGDVDEFREDYCGYIDCNTLRAGYPESKRTCEALCQAYIATGSMKAVIPRLPRTYGPTLLRSDSKALSQFLRNGVDGENIVLKSQGSQLFSYLYVADVVSGMLVCQSRGEVGRAYNVADGLSDIKLCDLAEMIAEICGTSVIFDIPEETELKGFSTATKAIMDASKLNGLGWRAKYSIQEGIHRTIEIFKEIDW